jgi:hypothetical protein
VRHKGAGCLDPEAGRYAGERARAFR